VYSNFTVEICKRLCECEEIPKRLREFEEIEILRKNCRGVSSKRRTLKNFVWNSASGSIAILCLKKPVLWALIYPRPNLFRPVEGYSRAH
jgi:hypothetical protein